MRTSQAGIDLIKRHEGLRLSAYLCPAGVWTIGYGSTRDVGRGDRITEHEAEQRLRSDLRTAEDAVNRLAGQAGLTQPQFDALVSFTFNLGAGALAGSTLLRKVNAGDMAGAVLEFARWKNARIDGVLTPLPGLIARRADEAALFASGITEARAEPAPEPPFSRPDYSPDPVVTEHETVSASGSVQAARIGAGAAAAGASVLSALPEITEQAEQARPLFELAERFGPWAIVVIIAAAWLYIERRRRRQIAQAKR